MKPKPKPKQQPKEIKIAVTEVKLDELELDNKKRTIIIRTRAEISTKDPKGFWGGKSPNYNPVGYPRVRGKYQILSRSKAEAIRAESQKK